MAAIVGINAPGKMEEAVSMLRLLAHRGPGGREVVEKDGVCLGVSVPHWESEALRTLKKDGEAWDYAGEGRYACARAERGRLRLKRDPLGAAPLYYGYNAEGVLYCASEVKALLGRVAAVQELPPGCELFEDEVLPYYHLEQKPPLADSAEQIARELRLRLEASVLGCLQVREVGSWLSGGLDSSLIAALACRHQPRMHTFAAGLRGAPDLKFGAQAAEFLRTNHHEIVVDLDQILLALPQVIYHLETFDALLIRSSVTNFLASQRASQYVDIVLSGEGGDELFGGYTYLKGLALADLPAELVDITGRLHNTALQRVDRCAMAHSTVAHTPFLDPGVVDYALRIPAEMKIKDGVEKWILRRAADGLLPPEVVDRPKAKFWEGSGVRTLLFEYAEKRISDSEFAMKRILKNGWRIATKEEYLYYKIFEEQFGALEDLEWMGRTKDAPVI